MSDGGVSVVSVTKPEVTRIRPPDLIERVREGRIRLPRFQRPFRWEPKDVEQLFDSVLRGYPIGNLLMWERSAPAEQMTIGHLRIQAPADDRAWWVVDGQQRLTGLVGALTSDAETTDPRFRIYYDLAVGEFTSLSRSRRPQEHQLPVAVAVDNRELLRWQRDRPWLNDAQFEQCDALSTAIRQYEIPVYIVQGDDEEALKNIFDRMNTFGKRMTRVEVFNALHSVSEDRSPSDLGSLGATSVAAGFGAVPQQLLMQCVMASREGRTDREFRNEFKDEDDRHEAFSRAERALDQAIAFLRETVGVPHIRLLPYSLFLPVLVRFATLFGTPEGRAAELLRRWVWRGSTVQVAPQGNTAALRNFAAAVADDPVGSAAGLLDLLPRRPGDRLWEPDLRQTGLNRAQAKLNVLAMLDLEPVLLETWRDAEGQEIATTGARVRTTAVLGALLDEHVPILQPIVTAEAAQRNPFGDSLANRIIHPPFAQGQAWQTLAGDDLSPEALHSHLLDRESLEHVRAHQVEEFLEFRGLELTDALSERVQRRALWGFDRARGPVELVAFDELESNLEVDGPATADRP